MHRLTLSHIDEELDSSEVGALCFLCRDVVSRKRLQGIKDAKELFLRLEERGLLEKPFISQLLRIIRRADLVSLLDADGGQPEPEETDSNPILSDYRVMLYQIYEDLTRENLNKMKFLLSDVLPKRQVEACDTALGVFAEMEKSGLLSDGNLKELYAVLLQLDQELALTVHRYMQRVTQVHQSAAPASQVNQRVDNRPTQHTVPVSETQPSDLRESVHSDAENTNSSSLSDESEYYALHHIPRGLCVIFNNDKFTGGGLKDRLGTQKDEVTLRTVFRQLGFQVVVHNDLTAEAMRLELRNLGMRNFLDDDVLVVCVLSHGENGSVYGADGEEVLLKEMTQPFTSEQAPTLAGKPKMFFIQACQGVDYQKGSFPCPPRPQQEGGVPEGRMEEDAGRVKGEKVASDADFLVGMATVPECKSFRNTTTGSIYIQELCRQLLRSANSFENDDILSVLTRVNREVSKGEYMKGNYKQMPQPKYTFTKKLVLKHTKPTWKILHLI